VKVLSKLNEAKASIEVPSMDISNDNGSFTFYVDVFFRLSLPSRLITSFWWSPCCSSALVLCIVFLLVIFCLRPVSCVPNVASFSRPSVLDCAFGFLPTFINPVETAKTKS